MGVVTEMGSFFAVEDEEFMGGGGEGHPDGGGDG